LLKSLDKITKYAMSDQAICSSRRKKCDFHIERRPDADYNTDIRYVTTLYTVNHKKVAVHL